MRLPPLTEGSLIRRYRRFLADVRLRDGSVVTAHCPNTGSLLGCDRPGAPVWLSRSEAPRRRLAWTWELVEPAPGVRVCIHTGRTNAIVAEAVEGGRIAPLAGYARLRREVRFGREGSRVDLLLEDPVRGRCFVEVKHVTAVDGAGHAIFPDAVTVRGRRHLRELVHHLRKGDRAVLVFCVARGDARALRPADEIDPAYGAALREALAAGIEAYAYACRVGTRSVAISRQLPLSLDGDVSGMPTAGD